MAMRTVRVTNVSLGATEKNLREFFSFSGEIEFVEMRKDNEQFQVAFVTFKDPKGAETSILLSGATIVDQPISIVSAPDYNLPAVAASDPPAASAPATENTGAETAGTTGTTGSAMQKAEDVVSSMLAKGFILGKDALNRAKSFDERHQLTSTASSKVASLDQKIGLSEKISVGTTVVNEKVREMDEKFQVSEKTKAAVNNAGSAIMTNRYVSTGASWVSQTFQRVAKAAVDVSQKTKEKMLAEDQQGKHGTPNVKP
ncbi:binding partner of ACD11 1-like isoform X2 [Cucurbita pepo subsp. pepo]|uniref:binding partner of ACD11 1-like isoform X2 n=1 Tax=Cucurbita pepo subsp. pepo TaxID=3664 RepID=UPI000C9D82C5|nr:binding partner of ACD11 1-like isoform X2 [Cucurbita pepo subsp. pepo]